MTIRVFGAKGTPAAGKAALFQRAIRLALGRMSRRSGELCVVLVDDREMRRINRRFLGHAYATDVIAFPHSPEGLPTAAAPAFADIYVAKGVSRRQARELSHPWLRELLTLAVHGALHLAGHDDGAPARKRRMFARQDAIVRRLLGR